MLRCPTIIAFLKEIVIDIHHISIMSFSAPFISSCASFVRFCCCFHVMSKRDTSSHLDYEFTLKTFYLLLEEF